MDISYKGPYTVIQDEDLLVTAEIIESKSDIKTDIIEIKCMIPSINEWHEITSAGSIIAANKLIDRYLAQKNESTESPSDHNFKLFA